MFFCAGLGLSSTQEGGVAAVIFTATLMLKMRYWLTVPEGFDSTGASVVFNIGGKKARSTKPIAIADALQPDGRYAFDFELSSIEMA